MDRKRTYDEFKNEMVFDKIEDVPHDISNLIKGGQYFYGGRLINHWTTKDDLEQFLVRVPVTRG